MPFYFRVNQVQIKDNREGKKWLLFGPSRAEVKLFSFITNGDDPLPEIDAYLAENDEGRKKDILKGIVSAVASSRIISEIQNVTDDFKMRFGDTGYVLYQRGEIPQDFNWAFLAIESDKDVRELGQRIDEVVNAPEFDTFASNVGLLVGAANPTFTVGVAVGKYIVSTVATGLENNKDDLIGVIYMSLNRREHYPHGERRRDDVIDLTNNMSVDYSLFGYED